MVEQIIESDDSNKFPALLLRSPAYQKSNKPFDSRTDAENSVDLKETPEVSSKESRESEDGSLLKKTFKEAHS